MRKTDNYELTLYDKEDNMSITAETNSLNANMKKIDSVLKEKATLTDMTNYIEEHKEELKGDTGPQGETGLQGPQGEKGATGKSAYEIWCDAGNWGSEEDFLMSLIGDKGEKGEKGNDGTNGKDGYSPIKGIDYWTEEDKVEIKEYVKDEIPTKTSELENDSGFLKEIELTQEQLDEIADAVVEAQKMEFVNSTEECTDITKQYVLPDGYIYAYMKKTVNVNHNANDGTMQINRRPQSNQPITANLSQNYGMVCSDAIAVDNTWDSCVLNVSGLESLYPTWYFSFIIWYYDVDGNWLGYQNPSNFGFASGEVEISLPISIDLARAYWANAGYIRLGFGIKDKNTQLTNEDIKNLVVNLERFNTVEEQYGWYSTGHMYNKDEYSQAIEQNASNIEILKTDVETLKEAVKTTPSQSGAVWYAVGDSITKGYGVGADNCWVKYVLDYNGYDKVKSKNLGISGLGFAKSDPNYHKTARMVVDENSFAGVDLVTIAIGINDWKEPFSIDTVKSEMAYCFEKILTDNPYCKIIFIVPFNIWLKGSASTNWALGYNGGDVTGGTLQNFIDTQKQVCKEYGIQIIDMTNDSVINKVNIQTVLYDKVHPNAECHIALGRELARRITYA